MPRLSRHHHTPLLECLTAYKSILETNGCIIVRNEPGRKQSYRIRFRAGCGNSGHRRQYAIPLGSDRKVAVEVKALLNQWQGDWEAKQAAPKRAHEQQLEARRLERREEREMLQAVALMSGGGSGVQRRVRKEFTEALRAGPIASALYVKGQEYLRTPRERKRLAMLSLGKLHAQISPQDNLQAAVQDRFRVRREQRVALQHQPAKVRTRNTSSKRLPLLCCMS